MIGAGRLNQRLQFQSPFEIDDGAGNTTQGWQPQFETAAGIQFLRGGETVLAARLEQTAPLIITVRVSTNTRQVTGEWRAIDMRSGTIYQVKENPRHPVDRSGKENRGHFEFLAMSGVAG